MHDEEFLDRFRVDPDAALDEYDLDESDERALKSGLDAEVRDHVGDRRAEAVYDIVAPAE